MIGGRLVVRPQWAPVPPPGMIDLVLAETAAFGAGTHPTTRTCLELLLDATPLGAFADLGCGSGVLAILAARLGWEPVTAVDIDPGSVETTILNAERNSVSIEARVADLSTEPVPPTAGFVANVPAELHGVIAAQLIASSAYGLCSGFGPDDADEVAAGYAARRLRERRRVSAAGWSVLVIRQD